jgi:lipid II isoglutaminyl synthase (glutamine-hydrolysing)
MWNVSKTLKLAVLYPGHLNLNGDAANFDVLQRRLEWSGISSEIHHIKKPTSLEKFDYVLLGHGSPDAWSQLADIEPDLIPNLVKLVRAGVPVMAVSSGYEILFEALSGSTTKHSERVSEFKDSDGVVGYVNSEAQLPEITWVENSLLTLFHGPVFAKNPEQADKFLGDVLRGAKNASSELSYVNELATASRRIAFED